ncbi:hypothetical protein LTS18_003848 [Coniosporium uncinatum]|uniref:Uncharacterized protein n=1 Tax=Coniosporium uncinatum TaxID=93489 RepID=A0ACC3DBD8_9PEZI|nr:hypothetical protein LTS18_003848 [Coniosporium uncinatum]
MANISPIITVFVSLPQNICAAVNGTGSGNGTYSGNKPIPFEGAASAAGISTGLFALVCAGIVGMLL